MKTLKQFVVAGLLVGAPAVALAQDAPAPDANAGGDAAAGEAAPEATPAPDANATPAPDAAPAAAGGGMMMAAKGKITIAGSTLNVNLSTDLVAKPISLAPNVWYGVNEKLNVGLTHDGGTTDWTPRPAVRTVVISIPNPLDPTMTITASGAAGSGICVTGKDNGCGKVYNNLGVDALYGLAEGKLTLAAHPALDILSISDPFALALRVGAIGNYAASDKLKIVFDPRIGIGLTERDAGNKETLDVPLWVWFAASDKLGAYLHTGINGPLDGFGDAFSIPIGVGASMKVNEQLSVGGDLHFTNMAGKNGGADARVLGIRAAYRL